MELNSPDKSKQQPMKLASASKGLDNSLEGSETRRESNTIQPPPASSLNPFVQNIIDGYTQEQADAIAETANKAQSDGFMVYIRSTDVRQYPSTSQWFAVFGGIARELKAFKTDDPDAKHNYEYLPAFRPNGETIEENPDEGHSGVMYLMRRVTPTVGPWSAVFLNMGWIYTKELELTPGEIAENIATDLDAGINLPYRS